MVANRRRVSKVSLTPGGGGSPQPLHASVAPQTFFSFCQHSFRVRSAHSVGFGLNFLHLPNVLVCGINSHWSSFHSGSPFGHAESLSHMCYRRMISAMGGLPVHRTCVFEAAPASPGISLLFLAIAHNLAREARSE